MTAQKPRPPGSLKQATAELIDAAGGLEAAALVSRVGKSTLHRYGDAGDPDAAMPADVIAALERVSGQPIVTRWLAHTAGYVLARPGLDGAQPQEVVHGLVRLSDAAGRLMAEALMALSDGRIDGDELGKVKAAIHELLDKCSAMNDTLRGME